MFYGICPGADELDSDATFRDEATRMDVVLSHFGTASVKFTDGEDTEDLVAWLDRIEQEIATPRNGRGW
jgi:hypothetical protein